MSTTSKSTKKVTPSRVKTVATPAPVPTAAQAAPKNPAQEKPASTTEKHTTKVTRTPPQTAAIRVLVAPDNPRAQRKSAQRPVHMMEKPTKMARPLNLPMVVRSALAKTKKSPVQAPVPPKTAHITEKPTKTVRPSKTTVTTVCAKTETQHVRTEHVRKRVLTKEKPTKTARPFPRQMAVTHAPAQAVRSDVPRSHVPPRPVNTTAKPTKKVTHIQPQMVATPALVAPESPFVRRKHVRKHAPTMVRLTTMAITSPPTTAVTSVHAAQAE